MRGGSGIGVGGVDLVGPAWLSARALQGKSVGMVGERCEWSNFWNVTRSEKLLLVEMRGLLVRLDSGVAGRGWCPGLDGANLAPVWAPPPCVTGQWRESRFVVLSLRAWTRANCLLCAIRCGWLRPLDNLLRMRVGWSTGTLQLARHALKLAWVAQHLRKSGSSWLHTVATAQDERYRDSKAIVTLLVATRTSSQR